MRRDRLGALALAGVLAAAGCEKPAAPTVAKEERKMHDRPDHGPHNGALAEWGDEDYHAEFTADREKNEVTVYILAKDAKTPSPIPSDKVTLASRNPPFQVDLNPLPEKTDPAGLSSRFVGQLPESARGRRLSGTLAAVVGGKPYSGSFREAPPHKD
jgi:hypothetical protein